MADLPKPGTAVKRDRVLPIANWLRCGRPPRKRLAVRPAVQLLILTAARREEIGSLRWSEIHGDEIRLPAERSKSPANPASSRCRRPRSS